MKRYRFRLEPVLRVRRIEQDAAQAGVATARLDLGDADAALHQSVERYGALPQPTGGMSTSAWMASRSVAERSAATVVAAGISRQVAAVRVDERGDALRQARMRVAALERLDERRRDEHALHARRDDDAEIDELVTTRHGRTS